MFENDFERLPWPAFIVRVLKNIYRFGIVVLLYMYQAFKNDPHPMLFMAGFIGIFLVLTTIPALLSHFTFKLKISAEQIQIKKGIFNRQERDIPYSRMQSVKEKQWFFFTPFNLTQLTIETAAGDNGNAEVELLAIPVELAKLIDDRRKKANNVATSPTSETTSLITEASPSDNNSAISQVDSAPQPMQSKISEAKKPLYQISVKQIILFSLTDLTMLLSLFVILEFFDQYFDNIFHEIITDADSLVKGSVFMLIGVVAAILFFIAICSFVKSFYKYYQFQVFKTKNDLTIEQGLLARNRIIVPVAKIQGIEIKQSLLRKIFKLSSVKLILATGNNDDDNKTVYLLPIINDNELVEVLQNLLPAWKFQATAYKKNPQPKVWYFIRWRLIVGVIACAVAFYFSLIIGASIVAGLILLLCAGVWESRVQGYQILDDHHMSVQSVAVITRTQSFLVRAKVQTLERKTSLWLHKKELSSLSMTVKAGDSAFTADLNYMPDRDNDTIQSWFLNK